MASVNQIPERNLDVGHGAQNSLLAYAHRILTAATPFYSLLPPLAALANVPLSTREPWGRGMRIAVTSVPNLSGILFPLVYSGFRRFLICFTYSLTLLSPLFPGVPEPYVVIYVVKNASRPVSGELSPGPDGKRFSLLLAAL